MKKMSSRSPSQILNAIKSGLANENKINSRRVLGRAWIQQDSFSVQVYKEIGAYNFNNILLHQQGVLEQSISANSFSGGTFNFSRFAEKKLLTLLYDVLRLNFSLFSGYVTSGGTEGNIYALWIARNWARKVTPKKQKTLWIMPNSAHYSAHKAIDLLNINLDSAHTIVYIPWDDNFVSSFDCIKSALCAHRAQYPESAVIVFLTAITTEFGTIDPILEVCTFVQSLSDKKTYIHVDAAYGGLVLPFVDQYKNIFSSPYISSVSIDFHKTFGGPIGSGAVFVNNGNERQVSIKANYLRDASDYTLIGSRSGLSAIQNWALLQLRIARMSYRISKAHALTLQLYERLKMIPGISFVQYPPNLNYLVFFFERLSLSDEQRLEKLLYTYSISSSEVTQNNGASIKLFKVIIQYSTPQSTLKNFMRDVHNWNKNRESI